MSAASPARPCHLSFRRLASCLALTMAFGSNPASAQVLALAGWSHAARDGLDLYVPQGERGEDTQLVQFDAGADAADAATQLAQMTAWVQQARKLATAGASGPVETLASAAGAWSLQIANWRSGPATTLALLACLPATPGGRRVVFISNSPERFKQTVPAVLLALKGAQPAGSTVVPAAPAIAATTTAGGSAWTGQALALPGDVKRLRIADLTGVWTADTAFRNQRIQVKEKTDHFSDKVTVTTSIVEDHPLGQGGQYLKVRADGHYEYLYAFSLTPGCWSRQSHEGRAEFADGILTLSPGEMRDASEAEPGAHCATGVRRSPGVAQRYRLDIAPTQSFYGLPTYALWPTALDGAAALGTLVRVASRPLPAAMPRSAGLEAPTLVPGRELTGTWSVVAVHGADPMDKVAPAEGRYEARLSLLAGGRYELRVQLPNVAHFPLCRRKLVLVEQGTVRQSTLHIQPNDRTAAHGSLQLQPTQSDLDDDVTQCGPDSGHRAARLPVAPRHFAVRVVMADGIAGQPRPGDQLFVYFQDRDDGHRTPWEFLFVPEVAGLEFGGYRRQ